MILDLTITQEAVEYLVQQYNLYSEYIYEMHPDSTPAVKNSIVYEKMEHCLSHYILTGERKNWRDV